MFPQNAARQVFEVRPKQRFANDCGSNGISWGSRIEWSGVLSQALAQLENYGGNGLKD